MRTTLSIDDDVLSAAKEMAARGKDSRGSHLFARKARIESTIRAEDAEWRSPLPVRQVLRG